MGWRDAYEKYKERIDADVAAAPALNTEQLARLCALLNAIPSKNAAPAVTSEGSESDPTRAKANHVKDTAA
jgi:hypothetical protein